MCVFPSAQLQGLQLSQTQNHCFIVNHSQQRLATRMTLICLLPDDIKEQYPQLLHTSQAANSQPHALLC
jgi:hypothetical protein